MIKVAPENKCQVIFAVGLLKGKTEAANKLPNVREMMLYLEVDWHGMLRSLMLVH